MTPEEIFNKQVWEILQEIQEEILATETGKPVKYKFPSIVSVGAPLPERRRKILYKLQEKKAFAILRNARGVRIGAGDIFYLIIDPLNFDKVYQKYQVICAPQESINFKQDGDYKKDIDRWLAKKGKRTLEKIWRVLSALNTEWQLRDEDIFDIPYDKSERARITNSKDLEIVLEDLHKHAAIEVSKSIKNSLPVDPNKPRSLWDIELEKLKMFETADTQVKIFPKQFTYIRDTLKEKVGQKDTKRFKEDYQQDRNQTNSPDSETIHCYGLNYSLINCQLSYKGGNAQTISPETREMKFFLTLYKNRNRVTDYKDIARDTGLESYEYLSEKGEKPHEKLSNSDFASDVGMLRRDFRKFVLLLGMPDKEFGKMIITITKKGYQLVCEEN